MYLFIYLRTYLFGICPLQPQLSLQRQPGVIVDPLNTVVMVNYGKSPSPQFQLNSRFATMVFHAPEFGEE
jgi:hypothetical protein